MLKQLSLAAILLASAAPMAHAQDSGDYDGDRYESPADREDAPPSRAEERDRRDKRMDERRMRDMRHGDRWALNAEEDRMEPRMGDRGMGGRPGPRGPNGPEGRRGPPPPPPQKAGFEIRMGEGRAVRVDCGDDMIAECVDAAQPILDAVAKMPAMAAKPMMSGMKMGDMKMEHDMSGMPGMGLEGDRVPPPPRGLVDGKDGQDGQTPPPPPSGAQPTPPAGGATPPAN